MTDERDLSQFLYRLTQEIVSSRDFSDRNVSKICDKYYANSSYPDKERLRKLVGELKRKLQIQQCDEFPQSSAQHTRLEDFPHRYGCSYFDDKHQCSCPAGETSVDKCVGTQSAVFTPPVALVDDETQYQEQLESCHTFSTTSPCNMSTCTGCSHAPSKQSIQRLSEESVTLIEQLLMKHAETTESNSSEILLRMAAANRALKCDSGYGKLPFQWSDEYTGEAEFGASGGASDVPILRQEPEESSTPPTTCCGTNRNKGTRKEAKRK